MTVNDNGLVVMVRIPTTEQHFISRILGAGALAVMLPHAETPEQIETVGTDRDRGPLDEIPPGR